MRLTADRDIRKVRAISAAFHSRPKRRANEICCPFGNLLNPPDLVFPGARRLAWRWCPGWCSRSGFALGTALISAIDLDGNGLEQPVKLGVVQVFE